MKTTIDIPEEVLRDAMKFTGAKTKREAVVSALSDYNRRQRLARLSKMLGSFEDFMGQEELQRMRKEP